MSTVSLPDDLVARLRAKEGDESSDINELVARALAKYVELPDAERLVRDAEELEAALARAGVTEEELADHFEQWRHLQCSGR